MFGTEWSREGVELNEVRNVGKGQTVGSYRPMVPKLENHLEGLLKYKFLDPIPRVSDSGDLVCIKEFASWNDLSFMLFCYFLDETTDVTEPQFPT